MFYLLQIITLPLTTRTVCRYMSLFSDRVGMKKKTLKKKAHLIKHISCVPFFVIFDFVVNSELFNNLELKPHKS